MWKRKTRGSLDDVIDSAIRREPIVRPPGAPASGEGGYDLPGYSITYVNGGFNVVLGCDDGDQIGFRMEPHIARKFFTRGVEMVNAAEVAELEREMRRA